MIFLFFWQNEYTIIMQLKILIILLKTVALFWDNARENWCIVLYKKVITFSDINISELNIK